MAAADAEGLEEIEDAVEDSLVAVVDSHEVDLVAGIVDVVVSLAVAAVVAFRVAEEEEEAVGSQEAEVGEAFHVVVAVALVASQEEGGKLNHR